MAVVKTARPIGMLLLSSALWTQAAWAQHGSPAEQVAKGAELFKAQCSACHVMEPGRGRPVPGRSNLADVNGCRAGESDPRTTIALKRSGVRWNYRSLAVFLANPQSMVLGTTMTPKVSDPKDAASIVAYLTASKGSCKQP